MFRLTAPQSRLVDLACRSLKTASICVRMTQLVGLLVAMSLSQPQVASAGHGLCGGFSFGSGHGHGGGRGFGLSLPRGGMSKLGGRAYAQKRSGNSFKKSFPTSQPHHTQQATGHGAKPAKSHAPATVKQQVLTDVVQASHHGQHDHHQDQSHHDHHTHHHHHGHSPWLPLAVWSLSRPGYPAYAPSYGPVYATPIASTTAVVVAEETPAAAPVEEEAQPAQPVAIDLELVNISLVDEGSAAEGPAYRIRLRNAGRADCTSSFTVLAMIAPGLEPDASYPFAQQELPALAAGEEQEIVVRLPASANLPVVTQQGQRAMANTLLVMVDSSEQVADVNRDNNSAAWDRTRVESDRPSLQQVRSLDNGHRHELLISGRGLGAEQGRVYVELGGVRLETEVLAWSHDEIRVRLPQVEVVKQVAADLTVVRNDGQSSDDLGFEIPAAGATVATN